MSGDTTSMGAAILAGVAVGLFKTIEQGVAAFVKFVERLEPDKERHEQYRHIIRVHSAIYEALNDAGVYQNHSDLQYEIQRV
jgi:xylulokinase